MKRLFHWLRRLFRRGPPELTASEIGDQFVLTDIAMRHPPNEEVAEQMRARREAQP